MRIIRLVVIASIAFINMPGNLDAQVTTNVAILKEAAIKQAALESKTYKELMKLALEKKWPVTIQGKSGKYAVLTGVDFQGYPMYTTTDNNTRSAATIGTSKLWPGGSTGLNLSGSGNAVKGKLGIWDGGKLRNTHLEFGNRITQRDNASTLTDHGTHVTGTLIASGVNPVAKGMAFGIQELIAYDFNNHLSEMLTEAPNLLVSNHSYGSIAGWRFNDTDNRWEFWGQAGTTEDYKFGYYSSDTQMWDSIAYNGPFYLIVKSVGNNRNENGPAVGENYWRFDAGGTMINSGNRPAGISNNDGYEIIPTYGSAKNILTVGAVEPIESGYSRKEDVILGDFSSWGPTDDGRIKPDIVADGIDLISPIATADNAYANLSGTSMSSPSVAGSILLLQEYYNKLHPGVFMRASTLKGLVIHTASEAGPDPGPDYQHGWGLINMEKAAAVITSNNTRQLIQENILNNGGVFSLPVIASGEGDLTATISWTDPKGAVETTNILNNPALKLVHDLDIRIKKGATIYQPWILNPASPSSAAQKGDNFRDNVEKVEVTDVIPGQAYTIEVTHKGSLQRGLQAYSLILSGVGGQPYCNSAPISTAGARIDSISIGTLQKGNAAGCTGYTNYSNFTAGIETNSSIPFFVKVSSCDASVAAKIVKAFMDFNNDGDFIDAGELIATSPVINGNGNYAGTINIPAGLVTGNYSMFRVTVQETNNAANVNPCGSYSNGETQDYRIQFLAPSKDMGISSIASPQPGDCASANQYVSINLKNFGRVAQSNIPVTVTVVNGATTIATINTTYPGTIAEYGESTFTLQTPFAAVAGNNYTITATTGLPGDQNNGNNQLISTVSIAGITAGPTGQAEVCGPNALLKVTNPVTGNLYSWFDTPAATTPIATGANASSTVLTANKTYYLSKNEVATNVGPSNKMVFTDGGYNAFVGNFVKFTNNVPVLIENVRLYTGNPGRIRFTAADISNFNETNGSYSYIPLASVTIDVYATDPTPQAGAQTGNDPADLGAIFLLNLPVVTPGDHAIIVECLDGATLFRNNNIPANPYPYTIPGVFSITGNSAVQAGDPNFYQKFYYFFYNMKIGLAECPSARTAIVASTATAPVITAVGNDFSSTAAPAYQWYRNAVAIPGANGQTYTATAAGVYKVITTDNFGCQLSSNEITSTITSVIEIDAAEIGLKTLPNPNNGNFTLQFEVKKKADMIISLVNITGQEVYRRTYPGFIGKFSQQVSVNMLPSDAYMLKIVHGSKVYLKKILIVQ
jgi:hypothetical protein